MILLRALALAAFLFIPGWLAFSLLRGDKGDVNGGERLFLAASLGVGTVSFCSLILALTSLYSLTLLLILVGSLCAAMGLAARKRIGWIFRLGFKDVILALAIAAIGLILFLSPWRIVFGWSDVGVYTNISTHIEQEGGISVENRVASMVDEERRGLLFYEEQDRSDDGIYFENQFFIIDDFESGTVRPWFYYLWPSLLAVFASFIGLSGQYWAVTVVAIMALWGFWLLAARLLGRRWAIAAAVLFALSPLILYFSHYTTSEMMNMLLFLSGSLCVLAYLRDEGGGGGSMAVLAAVFFSLGFFCRIDFIFVLAPIALCYLARRISGRITRDDRLFLALLAAGATLSILAGLLFSRVYFQFIWRDFFASLGWAYSPLGAVFVLGLLASLIFGRKLEGAVRKLRDARSLWVPALWLILCGAFVFLYFIRPQGADAVVGYGFIKEMRGPSYTNESLVRWGWYLSFAGLAAVFAGYAAWFARRRGYGEYTLGFIGLAYTLLYAWNMRAMPMHILVMRRLLPVVFPMAVLAVAYVLKSLLDGVGQMRRKPAWVAWASRVFVFAFLLYLILFSVNASVPLFGLDESGNQVELCEDIAADVGGEATLVMDYHLGDLFGSPLRCMYGVESAWLRDNAVLRESEFLSLLEDLDFTGSPIFLLWRPGSSGDNIPLVENLRLELVGEYRFREESLEKSFEHRPSRREFIDEAILLYRLRPENGGDGMPSLQPDP